MRPVMPDLPDDAAALRQCIADLAALATLPRHWVALGSRAVVESLAQALRPMLDAEFVYASVPDAPGGGIELAAARNRAAPRPDVEAIRAMLGAQRAAANDVFALGNPFGGSRLRAAAVPVGTGGAFIAAAAADARFPSGPQRLLLSVGASHLDMAMARRRSVTELADEARQLERRVANESEKRSAAEQALHQAQKMEAIGQLTGGIAHDFNNLLTVVIGNIDTLRRRAPRVPEFDRLAETALASAERAATLTQHLLAFARRQPLDPKPLDPNKLVSGMSDLLRRTLGERIAIETVLAGGLWRIMADANQLEAAILNLAVNARDAIEGAGTLTIETANAFLDEHYAQSCDDLAPGQYVMIAVSDTGVGMTQDVIDQAFEPFFTTKGVGRGTGLGLSQVYGFVRQSGGHVKIYSERGAGTTVKLYMPRYAAEAPEGEANPGVVPAPRARRGETILVVEDDPDVRQYASDVLLELGYIVQQATDAAAARDVLARNPDIALLFSDIGLPGGMNGRALAEAARASNPGLKVLFTTGYARNATLRQGRRDPHSDLLVKPFTYSALAARVRRLLDEG